MSQVQGADDKRLDDWWTKPADDWEKTRWKRLYLGDDSLETTTVASHVPDLAEELLEGEFLQEDESAPPGNPPSLGNCEKVPTSDFAKAQNHPTEYEYVERSSPEREVLLSARNRSSERLRVAMELMNVGETPHAKRFVECMRKSVQLECPPMAGGCGSDDNYTPMTCDSRVCPECGKRRQGKVAAKYGPVVDSWDHPTMIGLGLPDRVDPDHESLERGIDALKGAFGRLRRRVVPPNGPGWSWSEWKSALIRIGEKETARRWQKRYVRQDKGIPFDEIVPRGFYAIDVKEQDDGRLNVHGHVMVDTPWLPQAALSHLWEELVAAPVVDVRRVDGRGEKDAQKAALEVAGYAAKAPQYETAKAKAEYLKAVKGSKLVQPFGSLHGNTPEITGRLECNTCGESPRWWNYQGILDGRYDTMGANWVVDGDRPPP